MRFTLGHDFKDVCGALELDIHGGVALFLFMCVVHNWTKVADRRRHNEDIASIEECVDLMKHFFGGHNWVKNGTVRLFKSDRTSHEINVPARFNSGLGNGKAHFTCRRIADIAYRINKLAGRTRSNETTNRACIRHKH